MKELLYSVTASDCEFIYTKGTGAGGQKRNKTSSAVYCIHKASGARGYSEATRSQHDNKKDAFVKMVNTNEFKNWQHIEAMRRMGKLKEIEREVDRSLTPDRLRIEHKVDGKWVKLDDPTPTIPAA